MEGAPEKRKMAIGLVIIFAVVAVLTTSIMAIGSVFFKSSGEVAEEGRGDSKGLVRNEERSVTLTYSSQAIVDLDEELITLVFENPLKSRRYVVLDVIAIVDGEEISLAKTGKLKPGDRVESIKYKPSKKIEVGDYEGMFKLRFYDENNQEEMINSNIIISVAVR